MRIGIDARIGGTGSAGGVGMFVIGLAQGFSKLDGADDEYLFFVNPNEDQSWLTPYIGGNCRIVPARAKKKTSDSSIFRKGSYLCEKLTDKGTAMLNAKRFNAPRYVSGSNGRVEAAGIDLVHFTTQLGFATRLPYIYHPHDLQHRHYPEFFSEREVRYRDIVYRYFCHGSELVATVSSWVKSDVERAFELPPEKVAVVPYAPPNVGYGKPTESDLRDAAEKLNLPGEFAFYPAQTWKHKNHIGLLKAIAKIRDKGGPVIPCVFSGHLNEHYAEIERVVSELQLTETVQFLGFVSEVDLQCLYQLARIVVVPSLYEAASFPIWEAFHAGTPVACSSVTSLPRQVGEAGVLFDPSDIDDMAQKVGSVWGDASLRERLIRDGASRLRELSWDRTCRLFRAHYRRILQTDLTEEDQALLSAPPLL